MHSQHAFYACPFADVVAFDGMTDPLQEIAEDEGADAPVPLVPGPGEEENYAGHRQRNPNQVQAEVDGMLMPLAPVGEGAPQRFAFKKSHAKQSYAQRGNLGSLGNRRSATFLSFQDRHCLALHARSILRGTPCMDGPRPEGRSPRWSRLPTHPLCCRA